MVKCWDRPPVGREPHEMSAREELAFWHWTHGRIYGYQVARGTLYYHRDAGRLWIPVGPLSDPGSN